MLTHNDSLNIRIGMAGIPVVLLHAFPVNQKMWNPQIDMLNKNNIEFVAVDYPGFGQSKVVKKTMEMEDYGEVILDILRQLGVRKAVFVGLSMGGYVALALYRNHPGVFAGLVLANTRARADTDEARKKRFQMIDTLIKKGDPSFIYDLHRNIFFTRETQNNMPDLVEHVYSIMAECETEGIIQAQQAMAYRKNSLKLLNDINFPVLIISGQNDDIVGLGEAEEMVENCPEAALKIIEGAAHLSNLEKPDVFNQFLLGYLKKIYI